MYECRINQTCNNTEREKQIWGQYSRGDINTKPVTREKKQWRYQHTFGVGDADKKKTIDNNISENTKIWDVYTINMLNKWRLAKVKY